MVQLRIADGLWPCVRQMHSFIWLGKETMESLVSLIGIYYLTEYLLEGCADVPDALAYIRDRKLTTLGDLVVFVTWWNSLYMAQIISIWEWQ